VKEKCRKKKEDGKIENIRVTYLNGGGGGGKEVKSENRHT
jgi:hypothetical protein